MLLNTKIYNLPVQLFVKKKEMKFPIINELIFCRQNPQQTPATPLGKQKPGNCSYIYLC